MSELKAVPPLEDTSDRVSEVLQELPPVLASGLVYLLAALLLATAVYATVGQVDEIATASGRLAPEVPARQAKSLVAGRVRSLAVTEGERVAAEQVLVYLETETPRAQLQQAREELAIRKRQLQDLLAAQAEAAQVAETRARLAQAESAVAAAQRALDQSVILAPMRGQVTRLLIRGPGEAVDAGQVVAEIAPEGVPLRFETWIANRDLGRVRPGQRARVKLDAYPHQEHGALEARVHAISPDAEVAEGGSSRYRVQLSVQPPPPERRIELRLGLTGTTEIITQRRRILELFFQGLRGA